MWLKELDTLRAFGHIWAEPLSHLKLTKISTSHLLSIHELGKLLDEEMTEAEMRDLEGAEIVCRKLLACKFEDMGESGDDVGVKVKLAEILGRSDDTD